MANRYSRIASVAMIALTAVTLGTAQPSGLEQRAQACYDKHDYATGASLFLLAAQSGSAISDNLYNAACCFALGGQSDLAFETLMISIKKGWRDLQHTGSDADLASLHSDPRWKDVLAAFPAPPRGQANKDALINDLNNLAAWSFQYRIRPTSMGGGNGSYVGLRLPDKLAKNANGSFDVLSAGKNVLQFRATSAKGHGTIETSIDSNGVFFGWNYTGDFAVGGEPPATPAIIQDAKDAMINDLNNLAAWSYQYRVAPASTGGGSGSFLGLKFPPKMATNENGTYHATVDKDRVVIMGISAKDITATCGRDPASRCRTAGRWPTTSSGGSRRSGLAGSRTAS